ncbi:MAG: ATP synthase F0 subunit B [Pseudomonadota bacterium]
MELNITFIVQLAIFLTGVLWLSVVLFKPMLQLIEEREKRIEGTRREAERLMTSGGEKSGIIDIRIEEARAQAMEERTQLRAQGQKVYQGLVDGARQQAQDKLGKAREEIQKAQREASATLKQEADNLATLIVQQVVPGAGGKA